jgi:hypothetical protein
VSEERFVDVEFVGGRLRGGERYVGAPGFGGDGGASVVEAAQDGGGAGGWVGG